MSSLRSAFVLSTCATLLLAGCATTPTVPTKGADEDGCVTAKVFKLGPEGGSFTHGAVTVEAKAGDLPTATAFEIAACPGLKPYKLLSVETEVLPGLPSTRIRFADGKKHGPIAVAPDRMLSYCVDSSKLSAEDAAALLVVHDTKVGAPHPATFETPVAGRTCVGFAHLSLWHHLKHKIKHEAHKAEHEAKKVGHVVGKEAKKGAKAVAKQAKKLLNPCYDCTHAVAAAISAATCGNAWAKTKMTAECILRVDAEFPGLIEFTPAVCGAITAAVSVACKKLVKGTGLKSLEEKIENKVCKAVKLCKH